MIRYTLNSMNKYSVIGVMSGTSLDGIDIVYCQLLLNKKWNYKIIKSHTYKYSKQWKQKLISAHLLKEYPRIKKITVCELDEKFY